MARQKKQRIKQKAERKKRKNRSIKKMVMSRFADTCLVTKFLAFVLTLLFLQTERRGKKGGRFLLERLYKVQELGEDGQDRHQGAVWAIKFSSDGRHLATGGNDAILRVWRVEPQHVEDSNTGKYVLGSPAPLLRTYEQ